MDQCVVGDSHMDSGQGCLYVVPTPIGHRQDMTMRAIDTLQAVDWILCEDTRHSRPLLKHYGIDKPTHALHQFNESARSQWIQERIALGQKGALISDAGTPGISDPGQHLLALLWQQKVTIVPLPGPCAATTALSAAGFVHHHFLFGGFLPAKSAARRQAVLAIKNNTGPVVFYETARRLPDSLQDLCAVLGPLPILLAREMTKQHETLWRTDLQTAASECQSHWTLKGELVLVIELPTNVQKGLSADQVTVIKTLLPHFPLRQVADMVSALSGQSRNVCYQQALLARDDAL